MKIVIVRHGKTEGNLQGRYIGKTNQHILDSEKEALLDLKGRIKERNLNIKKVFVSPMERCIDTAQVLFGDLGVSFEKVDNLREIDFGDFEYKNYEDLKDNEYYQAYIDSNGELPFPNGECKADFTVRCVEAFKEKVNSFSRECSKDLCCDELVPGMKSPEAVKTKEALENNCFDVDAAVVVHAGTIMAIMDKLSVPHKDYFDWRVDNGIGLLVEAIFDSSGKIEGLKLYDYI